MSVSTLNETLLNNHLKATDGEWMDTETYETNKTLEGLFQKSLTHLKYDEEGGVWELYSHQASYDMLYVLEDYGLSYYIVINPDFIKKQRGYELIILIGSDKDFKEYNGKHPLY